jgi:hypothetical protein
MAFFFTPHKHLLKSGTIWSAMKGVEIKIATCKAAMKYQQ